MLIEDLYKIYLEHQHICTDSRKVENKAIFFSLKGDNFDGNTCAEDAIKKGCKYAVVDNFNYCKDNRYILVENALSTLQELAKFHRSNLKIPIIGITGTNGKTTTKELINAVLSKKYKTLATTGNLNNHIGVPQTILKITKDTEIAIIEMGANHIGEIAALCEISQPNYGIITNIGKAHFEGFGNYEGVIKTKKELYQWIINNKGTIFVNGDNELLSNLSNTINRKTYGKSSKYDYVGKIVNSNPFLITEWFDKKNHQTNKIKSQLIGNYNFENILAAIAVGSFFNIEANKIIEAIATYTPSNNRSQIIKTDYNTVIMDAYNANPSSMEAAINNFADISYGKKVVILGDMLELGNESEIEHKNILELTIKKGFSTILLVGNNFSKINTNKSISTFIDSEKLANWLKNKKIRNATILVKGSRGIKMEKIFEYL